MSLKDKILNFLKGLRRSPRKKAKFQNEGDPALFPPDPTGKRPKGFRMPKWAQKDYFAQKDLGTMVPPEELADEASLRRPGDWLRTKLAGSEEAQAFENIQKTKYNARRKVGMSDPEIDSFLDNVLKEKPGKGGKKSKAGTPKKRRPR